MTQNNETELHEVVSFNDLLEMRDDLGEINDNLDQIADYWANVSEVLSEQAGAVDGEKEKAIEETSKTAADVAKRIDEGEALFEARNSE
jgi:predicted component of type VI protein secretion system